jgi:urease accessory protein
MSGARVITAIVGRLDDLAASRRIDPLELTSEERANTHFVAETASGRQLRVSLPRGTELQDGDVLALDAETAVVVKAAAEDLLLLTPGDDPVSWWAACYQLGNLHRPARFRADGIVTLYDPMALQIVRGLGVAIERIHEPFVGRRFGAAGAHHHLPADDHHEHDHDHHHDHGHDHGHSHAHDPVLGHRHGPHGHEH